jgi:hypothetical protein
MCTASATGSEFREPTTTASHAWRGTTYSVTCVRRPHTDWSVEPETCLAEGDATFSTDVSIGRRFDAPSCTFFQD